MPQVGVFRCRYVCAPENRNFYMRKELFENYGHWRLQAGAQDIMWWSTLSEAPDDVLELLEFMIDKYPNLQKPFRIIDGDGGNGVIGKDEFRQGIRKMGCKKFTGAFADIQIQSIFNFLDPSGEGTVSKREWLVLDQLWKELTLSFQEFVRFLGREFDWAVDCLDLAWDKLDQDQSGSVSRDEWQSIVQGEYKYFGPCKRIFEFLDQDDEGTIEREEFAKLNKVLEEQPEYKKVHFRRKAVRTAPASISAESSG